MRFCNLSRARWFISALIGGLTAMLVTLVLTAPAGATIIGPTNDLHQIPNSTAYPYSAVVEITLGYDDAGKSLGRCTGWMYASNMVATAAHCVYDPAYVAGGYFHTSGMRVSPAINGSSNAPFGSCGVVASRAAAAYIGGDWRFDYAALKLDCAVGSQTGVLNYGLQPTVGYSTRVVGYPAGTQYPVDTQWYSDDHVGTFDAYLVYYGNDTEPRMSGSPVMEWTGSAWNVVAIHSRGYNASYNTGPRITSAVSTDLYNWQYI